MSLIRKTSLVEAGQAGRTGQLNRLRDEASASAYLLAYAQTEPDLTLRVNGGRVYFGNQLVEFAGGNSPSFTAPSSDPRIDVLSLDDEGTLVRTAGTEAAEPETPAVPFGNSPICAVFNRVGQTQIDSEDQEDGDGYILTDLRNVLVPSTVGVAWAEPRTETLNPDTQSTESTSFVKLKEIQVHKHFLSIHIFWEFRSTNTGGSGSNVANTRVHVNGTAFTDSLASGGVSGFEAADFHVPQALEPGDLVQIYGRVVNEPRICQVRNMQLGFIDVPVANSDDFTNQDPG